MSTTPNSLDAGEVLANLDEQERLFNVAMAEDCLTEELMITADDRGLGEVYYDLQTTKEVASLEDCGPETVMVPDGEVAERMNLSAAEYFLSLHENREYLATALRSALARAEAAEPRVAGLEARQQTLYDALGDAQGERDVLRRQETRLLAERPRLVEVAQEELRQRVLATLYSVDDDKMVTTGVSVIAHCAPLTLAAVEAALALEANDGKAKTD